MREWMAADPRRRAFVIATGAVLVVSIAYALIIHYTLFGDRAVTAIDDFGEALAAGIAAVACAWAARRAHGKDRLGWALIGISAALWGAGEVVWAIDEVVLGVQPYPSLADAGFLAAVPFAIAGIRCFWGAARGTSAQWRVWFDGLIVGLALISTAWGFGLREVWNSDSSTKVFDLAYPVSDVLIGTVLILAIRRATEQHKARMAFLLAGVALYSIADSAFAYLNAQNAFGSVGNVIDTGWFAGYLLVALAAVYPDAAPRPVAKQAPLDLWQLALPWMTLLTASAGDLYSALSGHELDVLQTSLTGILALLLTVNMILERREFLELLIELDESHSKLSLEFKTALVAIERFSAHIRDAEPLDVDDVRRTAAEIHDDATRLDAMLVDLLEPDEGKDARGIVAGGVKAAAGAAVAARSGS